MAIMAMFSGPITKAQYESLRREVGWEREIAPGGMVHAATFDDASLFCHLCISTTWSEEAIGKLEEAKDRGGYDRRNHRTS
jgi:hypothetical protein